MSLRSRVLSCLVLLTPCVVEAATFTVTSTANAGAGSLRQAVLDANAAAGADSIAFAIAGNGPHTIALQGSALSVTGALLIDGYSQAGAQANTRTPQQGGLDASLRIVLVPAGTSPASSAIFVGATELTLRGLVIAGFGQSGAVVVNNASAIARIEGCWFGTDTSGMQAYAPAGVHGMAVSAGRFHVGGPVPAQRNLFAGHAGDALIIRTSAAADSTIEGNLFGTTADGLAALGNSRAVVIRSSGQFALRRLRIGGTTMASMNVISANRIAAIRLDCASATQVGCLDELSIQGNRIGTDAVGLGALPNATDCAPGGCGGAAAAGIDITGLSLGHLVIGGTLPGAGNRIAFNRGVGVGWEVTAGAVVGAVEIVGNAFDHNGAAGIALIRANVTPPNDAGDADEGANRFQNTPLIEAVQVLGGGTQMAVTYRVDTAVANAAYPLRVDFYASVDGDEGSEPLGSDVYTAAEAPQSKTIMLSLVPGPPVLPVVATATDAEGHTSAFSLGDLIFRNGFDVD